MCLQLNVNVKLKNRSAVSQTLVGFSWFATGTSIILLFLLVVLSCPATSAKDKDLKAALISYNKVVMYSLRGLQ